MTERKTRCKIGLDLQGKVGIATTQKPAPRELSRFDVLMCEQSEVWKNKFVDKFAICLIDKESQKITKIYVRFKKKGEESQFIFRTRWKKKLKNC